MSEVVVIDVQVGQRSHPDLAHSTRVKWGHWRDCFPYHDTLIYHRKESVQKCSLNISGLCIPLYLCMYVSVITCANNIVFWHFIQISSQINQVPVSLRGHNAFIHSPTLPYESSLFCDMDRESWLTATDFCCLLLVVCSNAGPEQSQVKGNCPLSAWSTLFWNVQSQRSSYDKWP